VNIEYGGKGLRILDFDIENRPISYGGQDFTFAEVTAIACAWIVDGKPKGLRCWLLTPERASLDKMLTEFRKRYEQADIVTGHYITGHDLPVLNGAYLRRGLAPLGSKLAHDTSTNLKRRKYVSKSQESLGAMLGIDAPKVWRSARSYAGSVFTP
jgi:hypothetical protein